MEFQPCGLQMLPTGIAIYMRGNNIYLQSYKNARDKKNKQTITFWLLEE